MDPLLDELLRDLPALLLVGPRAAGKATTAQRRARQILRLTDRNQAAALRAAPAAVLASIEQSPLLIDEWQLVPDVLAAVKLGVDNGAAPGSFLLTGSTRAEMSVVGWPATGRVVRVPLWGLTQRELVGTVAQPSIDLLLEGPAGAVVTIEVKAASHVDRADARHLLWLRDEIGSQFAAGVVFHTGSLGFRIDARIWALPIAAIWAPHR